MNDQNCCRGRWMTAVVAVLFSGVIFCDSALAQFPPASTGANNVNFVLENFWNGNENVIVINQLPVVYHHAEASITNDTGGDVLVVVCDQSGKREIPIGVIGPDKTIDLPYARDPRSGVPGFVLKLIPVHGEFIFDISIIPQFIE